MGSDYQISRFSEDALPQQISPEGAEVANIYLANACSVNLTSKELNRPATEISAMLQEPLVKAYVHGILKETGYAHMDRISQKLDEIIDKKWEEIEEADIGSNKDIADLLQMAHKMRLDMIKFLQNENTKTPVNQKNTQLNIFGEGHYGKLMERLLTD